MDKVKFGVFGTWRGLAYIKAIQMIDEAEVVAIYDKDEEKMQNAKPYCADHVKLCHSYDELLDSGIDAVILCNYFPEHAPFAVKALKKGLHVFSETTPAVTLKQCVDLVEAVEESGKLYALAENYPYSPACMEIARVYQSGSLGEVIYAEGEYVHPMSDAEQLHYAPDPDHWRNHNPKTYYSTHAFTPLMAATGLMPKRVIGKIAARPGGKGRIDGAGLIVIEMENGAIFRLSSSCDFGPKGNWYRLGCEKGGIESVRGTNDKIRLVYNEWNLDETNSEFGTECIYTPAVSEMGKKAMASGHAGGDFWVTWHFVQAILGNEKPAVDVYHAAAISATGILAWRSALEDSKQMDIPDFSNAEERNKVRDDDLSPFPYNGVPASIGHAYWDNRND